MKPFAQMVAALWLLAFVGACNGESEPGAIGTGGQVDTGPGGTSGSGGSGGGGGGGEGGVGGSGGGEGGAGGDGGQTAGGGGEGGGGAHGEGGSGGFGGVGGSGILVDEYGACARGCPADRPHCTPAGSCSSCEDGRCGNELVFARSISGGFAPLGATAWPDELRVGGVIADGLDLGAGPLSTAHTPIDVLTQREERGDLYLAALAGTGSLRTVDTITSSGRAGIQEIEHRGNRVLVRGEFGSDLTLGETTLTGAATPRNDFVVLLDEDGAVVWQATFLYPGQDLYDATLMTDGDVVLSGSIGRDQSIDFGGGPLFANDFNGNSFLARLGPEGEHRFSRIFGEGTVRPLGIGAAPDGGFVVTGSLSNRADLGGGELRNESSYATFVARFDAAGAHLWSRRYPEPGNNFIDTRGSHVAVAHDGSIFFGAECGGTLGFEGGAQLVVEGHFSPCVFSLDPRGGYRAGIVLPSTSRARLWGLRVDPWGKPVLLADFTSPLTIDGETFSPGARTAVVLRADPQTMQPDFVAFVGGAADVEATALAVSSDGAIFVAGAHEGALPLPDGTTASEPGLFLLRWSP